LSGNYMLQGKYAEAERLRRRALTIIEKAFGSEHTNMPDFLGAADSEIPNVADDLDELAFLCRKQDKPAEAESLEERAKKIRDKRDKEENLDYDD